MPKDVVTQAVDEYTGNTGVVYKNPAGAWLLEGGAAKNEAAGSGGNGSGSSPVVSDNAFMMDIAQSHHYTIQLSGFTHYKTPEGSFSDFLPTKSINLTYTSYENMSIPVSIFGDFPLLNRKRVSTIALTCYDRDNNKLEFELKQWEAQCFPKGRYVAYMEDIARKLTYRGYSVDGRQTLIYSVYVIPSGNVSVSRDYSANDAKLLNFSLVCVGDGSTCATGAEGPGIIVEDHGGMGDGRLPKGRFHTLYATGYGTWNNKEQRFD